MPPSPPSQFKSCPECHRPTEDWSHVCPDCGYEWPEPDAELPRLQVAAGVVLSLGSLVLVLATEGPAGLWFMGPALVLAGGGRRGRSSRILEGVLLALILLALASTLFQLGTVYSDRAVISRAPFIWGLRGVACLLWGWIMRELRRRTRGGGGDDPSPGPVPGPPEGRA
jgi:hypothetical protein